MTVPALIPTGPVCPQAANGYGITLDAEIQETHASVCPFLLLRKLIWSWTARTAWPVLPFRPRPTKVTPRQAVGT